MSCSELGPLPVMRMIDCCGVVSSTILKAEGRFCEVLDEFLGRAKDSLHAAIFHTAPLHIHRAYLSMPGLAWHRHTHSSILVHFPTHPKYAPIFAFYWYPLIVYSVSFSFCHHPCYLCHLIFSQGEMCKSKKGVKDARPGSALWKGPKANLAGFLATDQLKHI